jgi:hypothetical protein
MDDSFSFRTSLPLRRQFDPVVVKAAVSGILVVLGIGLFANWVIRSERESFARADRRVTASRAETTETVGASQAATIDAEVDEATRSALDGPSTTARIVSVAATTDAWAATVLGSGGVCHWIRASVGAVTRGAGLECTGTAALGPSAPR